MPNDLQFDSFAIEKANPLSFEVEEKAWHPDVEAC